MLQLLATAATNKKIAVALVVSGQTVWRSLNNIRHQDRGLNPGRRDRLRLPPRPRPTRLVMPRAAPGFLARRSGGD